MSDYQREPYRSRSAITALLILLLLVTLATACNPLKRPTTVMYTLTPPSGTSESRPTLQVLAVGEPSASEAERGHRIVVQEGPHALKYLAGGQWIARAPAMVQTLLIQHFEASGQTETLYRDAFGLADGFSLESELREMRAVFEEAGQPPEIRVELAVRLRNVASSEYVGYRRFRSVARAENDMTEAIIAAFDKALGQLCLDVVGWTVDIANRS